MRLSPLRSRPPRRCATCHGALGGEPLVSCAGCGVRLHEDCAALGCPSLGCDGQPGARSEVAPRRAPLELAQELSEALRQDRQGIRRIERVSGLRRVLGFLDLSIHDVINDAAARAKVGQFYKIQRSAARVRREAERRRGQAYEDWLERNL